MKHKEKKKETELNKRSISELWENFKKINIHAFGVCKGEGRSGGQGEGQRIYWNNNWKISGFVNNY